MERTEISRKVRAVFSEHIATMRVKENHRIDTDLGFDSLDMVEILMKLENSLKVDVNTEDEREFYALGTVGEVVDFMDTIINNKGGGHGIQD